MGVIYLKTTEKHHEASYFYFGSPKIPVTHCINFKETNSWKDPDSESSTDPHSLGLESSAVWRLLDLSWQLSEISDLYTRPDTSLLRFSIFLFFPEMLDFLFFFLYFSSLFIRFLIQNLRMPDVFPFFISHQI